jgi:putative hemolysin
LAASFLTPAVNEEELKMMVEASEEQGVLEAEETEMINSILDFSNTVVRKVMTPRIDLTGIPASSSLPELVACISHSGHSRIPIYDGDMDNIVGIVHAKDLLALLSGDDKNETPIRAVMRPPYFIPETKKVDELLSEFRRSHQQIAIVRDEYGITSGIITIEDLLEEIVGDIQDEYDTDEIVVQVLDSNTTIFDGKTGLDDVNDRMGLELPDDEADTLGGFVFGLLGHQAEKGESAAWENLTFVVEETDGKRITRVRLLKHADDTEPLLPNGTPLHTNGNGHAPQFVEIAGVETAPGVLTR